MAAFTHVGKQMFQGSTHIADAVSADFAKLLCDRLNRPALGDVGPSIEERPVIGRKYIYRPNRGEDRIVTVTGFRKGYVETMGEDGFHRSASSKQLHKLPAVDPL